MAEGEGGEGCERVLRIGWMDGWVWIRVWG